MLTLQSVFTREALILASKRIKRSSGVGMDGITPEQFSERLKDSGFIETLLKQLHSGSYRPSLLLKKRRMKPNGKYREIFIPTVQDRVIQKVIVKALIPPTEVRFHEQSYGFRSKRNTHQAVKEASRLIREGYSVCYLVDLENFFGKIDLERMRKLLRDYPIDTDLRSLINAFMTAKVVGVYASRANGIPAGIPLAPILANIYLHPVDKALSSHGIQFVRYADDISLFFKSKQDCLSGQNFWGDCEQRFKITINREKTKIYSEDIRPILGFNLSEYGGITAGPAVMDEIRESLSGLFAAPKSPLFEKIEKARVMIHSRLAYYEVAENYNDLISQTADCLQRILKPLRLSPLEIAEVAKIEIHRVDEAAHFTATDLIEVILPKPKLTN